MEVRCDHCQSEHKLEDATTLGSRTSVKCSDCGHIIVLGPKTPAPEEPKSGHATPPPEVVEWLVETTHGRTLRSPDLATLHRWIIERRVTREDRISRDGQSWQRVGDVPDLVPFFDIVDSAERARRADTPGPMVLPAPPPMAATPTRSPPVELGRGALPEVEDRTETKVVVAGPSYIPLLLKLVLTVVVAALVAFAGIAFYHWRLGSRDAAPQATVSVPAPPPAQSQPAPPPVAPQPVVEETPEPEGAEPGGPALEPAGRAQERANVAPSRKKARGGGRAATARAAKAAAAPHHPTAAPSGAASGAPQAAQGYAALNRRQFDQAINFFKQALASNPSNGTALFGLAEAYRETGQKAQALKCYRRYIQLLPSGPDAGSARLQIRLLESKR
jgi:predicted Zn finger-like uncharacterized protein